MSTFMKHLDALENHKPSEIDFQSQTQEQQEKHQVLGSRYRLSSLFSNLSNYRV